MAGRHAGVPNKDKPFRDALRMAISDAEGDHKALRKVALALLAKAMEGDVAAIREVGDRLDGKVAQTHGQDAESGPIEYTLRWLKDGK